MSGIDQAAGQRTRSVVTSGSVTTTTTYTYEGLSLLSLAATQSTGTTYSVSYLYDAQARPYAGVYGSGAATPTLFRIVTTDRGDVVELLSAAGTAFAAYRYDAWGVPTETTSTAAGTITSAVAAAIASRQPLRYAGYAYDEHSGLYYLSARSYDPVTRQFLSKDPAKDDGEESAYQYCGGDPVGRKDPTGLFTGGLHLTRAVFRVVRVQVDWIGTFVVNWVTGKFLPAFTSRGLPLGWEILVSITESGWKNHQEGMRSYRTNHSSSMSLQYFVWGEVSPGDRLSSWVHDVQTEAFNRYQRSVRRRTSTIIEGNPFRGENQEVVVDLVRRDAPEEARLIRGIRFNPAAFLLPPFWGPVHGAWEGIPVVLPAIVWPYVASILFQYVPSEGLQDVMLSPLLRVVMFLLPAAWFGWRADDIAWSRAGEGRWTPASYRAAQRRWFFFAAVAVAVRYGLEYLR